MHFYYTDEVIRLPKYASEEETTALISENGEILLTAIGMEVRIQDMEFLYYDTFVDDDGTEYPLINEADINYVAVQFSDGSEYVVEKDVDGVFISNCMDATIYQQDYTFGNHIFHLIPLQKYPAHEGKALHRLHKAPCCDRHRKAHRRLWHQHRFSCRALRL